MPYYYPLKKMTKPERFWTITKLLKLREQLRVIPNKTATETLLLATWNIRKFGDNRRWESLFYMAEIMSRFDLVAVQEVTESLKGLDKLIFLLGPNWDYIVTDQTDGSAGAGERLAFVFDRNKIVFKKMAGQIVLPKDKLIKIGSEAEGNAEGLQFARTPYCVAFQAGWFKFVLTAVHIYFGDLSAAKKKRREDEINMITSVLSKRAKKEDTNYILLGDFNIPNLKDPMMKKLEQYGFFVPDALKQHPTDLGQQKHYDQIALNLKLGPAMTVFAEKEQMAGSFNFSETVYANIREDFEHYKPYFKDKIEGKTEKEAEKYYLTSWRTFEMSDHLPLWVELKVDFSNPYLERLKDESEATKQ